MPTVERCFRDRTKVAARLDSGGGVVVVVGVGAAIAIVGGVGVALKSWYDP